MKWILECSVGGETRVAAVRVNIINYCDSFKKLQRFCQYSISLPESTGRVKEAISYGEWVCGSSERCARQKANKDIPKGTRGVSGLGIEDWGGGSISIFPCSNPGKITHDASPFLIKISLHRPKCVASLISGHFNTLLRLHT